MLPLAAHCLDVGLVFRKLCEVDGIKRALKRTTSTELSPYKLDRLAVLAMLHDIGKVNWGFQLKVFPDSKVRAGHIREIAPILEEPVLSQRLSSVLPPEMHYWFSDPHVFQSYFFAILSHHGKPVVFDDSQRGYLKLARKYWTASRLDPFEGIGEIAQWARYAFPQAFSQHNETLPSEPKFHHLFAGLVMLADWIGSHPQWFPVEGVELPERFEHGKAVVDRVLQSIGLDSRSFRPLLGGLGDRFSDRFPFHPRPLQEIIDQLDPEHPNTNLLIAESETGSGKTEAAINWFCKLFMSGKVDGLYFALPTRVAAIELYERVLDTVKRWFPQEENRPNVLLAVPGYAQMDGMNPKDLIAGPEDSNLWQEDPDIQISERLWAAERPKRFLASTIAVGTIDQALLSIVQTAHAHLRSICLSRSLLVVDEVHASDRYMSQLLSTLLDHHLAVGGKALLLSATLGSSAKILFLRSTNPKSTSLPEATETPYPAVTLADGTLISTPQVQDEKKVYLETLPYSFRLNQLTEYVVQQLESGARVLVVLNTVARAVELFSYVSSHPGVKREWLFKCAGQSCPHHGRFAPEDRTVLDKAITEQFGKRSPSGPRLLIGTQTLEQSLDIDADLLITDLVPSDVLLQRIGRLHRHKRTRPKGFEEALCLVLVPEQSLETGLDHRGEVSGFLKKAGFGSVYEDVRTLERTWQIINEHPVVVIPRDNRLLVEKATHPESLNMLNSDCWNAHGQAMWGKDAARAIAASTVSSTYDQYFGEFRFVDSGTKVTTRLGADQYRVLLSKAVESPFRQILREMTIPSHMAPSETPEVAVVEAVEDGAIVFRWSDKLYRYSSLGLEEVK